MAYYQLALVISVQTRCPPQFARLVTICLGKSLRSIYRQRGYVAIFGFNIPI